MSTCFHLQTDSSLIIGTNSTLLSFIKPPSKKKEKKKNISDLPSRNTQRVQMPEGREGGVVTSDRRACSAPAPDTEFVSVVVVAIVANIFFATYQRWLRDRKGCEERYWLPAPTVKATSPFGQLRSSLTPVPPTARILRHTERTHIIYGILILSMRNTVVRSLPTSRPNHQQWTQASVFQKT